MNRVTRATIEANRPRRGVRVVALAAGVAHLVVCGSCDHAQVVRGPKAAADELARWHRQTHRSSS